MAPDERAALIALNLVPRLGAVKARALARRFGSCAAAAEAGAEAIAAECKEIGPVLAEAYVRALREGAPAREEETAAAQGVRILTWGEPDYPACLRALPSPPLCLYCAGDAGLLAARQVAVVGTRYASLYGTEQARRFARRLAEAGLGVTSGLAEGIDSAAHEGALQAGADAPGKTIAVIGAALDRVYPASRKPLAREIVRAGGLVVSEYPFGRHGDRQTFPQRNRIVAALAEATLVAECALKSGTHITVGFARELGRRVFAIPGRADWPGFAGNHALLREGVARLVTSPDQILDDLSGLPFFPAEAAEPAAGPADAPLGLGPADAPLGLGPDERAVWDALATGERSLDALCAQAALPLPAVSAAVTALRMRRLLRALPGGLVGRVPPRG